MRALAERRARITRVREVQHLHAVSEAATAEGVKFDAGLLQLARKVEAQR